MNHKKRLLSFPLLFSFLLVPLFSYAECYYERAIEAEEFQIGIMLSWSTNNEFNNERFIIEKSEDGVVFEEVGNVEAAGTSGDILDYNYLHIYPQEKRLYYRLKQIDFDGTSSYSDIAIFQLEKQTDVHVLRLSDAFTTEEFNITLDSYTEGELTYTLHAWNGDMVRQEQHQLINGVNNLNINTVGLNPGIYRVVLAMEEELDVLTFKKVIEKDEVPVARGNK